MPLRTLPPAVPQLAETTSLAQAVEALLLNELQDLGLDPLPQLTAKHERCRRHTRVGVDGGRA